MKLNQATKFPPLSPNIIQFQFVSEVWSEVDVNREAAHREHGYDSYLVTREQQMLWSENYNNSPQRCNKMLLDKKQDLKDLLDPEFSIITVFLEMAYGFWLVVKCLGIAPCYAISELLFGILEWSKNRFTWSLRPVILGQNLNFTSYSDMCSVKKSNHLQGFHSNSFQTSTEASHRFSISAWPLLDLLLTFKRQKVGAWWGQV